MIDLKDKDKVLKDYYIMFLPTNKITFTLLKTQNFSLVLDEL